jgi:hypothetical protein
MELYEIKIQELDDNFEYSLIELSGLTGLGQDTLRRLIQEGEFHSHEEKGVETVRGSDFLKWSKSVHNKIEVN